MAEVGPGEHGGPEQAVEVDDVLADEVMHLGLAVGLPEIVELEPLGALAEVLEARHVADRRVHPDVEVLVLRSRDVEAEVGCVAADVPGLEAPGQPLGELVGDFRLNRVRRRPFLEEVGELREVDEVVRRLAQFRLGVGEHGPRVDQLRGVVGRAALLAVVAVLVVGATARAVALQVAVGEEELAYRVVELLDVGRERVPALGEAGIDQVVVVLVLRRVRGIVVVVADVEASKVLGVLRAKALDQRFRGYPLAFRGKHRRRAMRIVRAHVDALVAHHALEPDPDVGLDVFEHVAKVNGPVCVRQGAGDQDAAHGMTRLRE